MTTQPPSPAQPPKERLTRWQKAVFDTFARNISDPATVLVIREIEAALQSAEQAQPAQTGEPKE